MPGNQKTQKNQKTRLRGSAPSPKAQPKAQKAKNTTQKAAGPSATVAFAPTSIGTTVRGTQQSVSHGKDSVTISGRDYIATVAETAQTNWFLGAVVPLSPVYFANSAMANIARTYRYYRFKRLVAHFVTRQPTSAAGEVILTHHMNPSKEFFRSDTSSFLPRIMATQSSIMGPLWLNHSMPIKTSASWCEVDGLSNIDVDDNICGELLAYVQSPISDSLGYILLDYTVEFKTVYMNEQIQNMPLSYVSERCTVQDFAAPVVANQLATALPPALSSATNGTVVKCVFDTTGTAFTAPITAANALNVKNGLNTVTLAATDGMTLYGVVSGFNLLFFPTIESATDMSTNILVQYATAGATKTTWAFTHYMIQWSPSTKT